jgi:hypothetical protein
MRIQDTDRVLRDARFGRQKKQEIVIDGPWRFAPPRAAIIAGIVAMTLAAAGAAVWYFMQKD